MPSLKVPIPLSLATPPQRVWYNRDTKGDKPMPNDYNEIYAMETEETIQDLIVKVSNFHPELGARMKFALQSKLSEVHNAAYDQGYRDGNVGPATPEPGDNGDDDLPF